MVISAERPCIPLFTATRQLGYKQRQQQQLTKLQQQTRRRLPPAAASSSGSGGSAGETAVADCLAAYLRTQNGSDVRGIALDCESVGRVVEGKVVGCVGRVVVQWRV